MTSELSKFLVDALQPTGADKFTWDGKINGFGVKTTPAGRKVFIFVYRFPRGRVGKVRRFTIGSYGDITVEQARRIAKTLQGNVADRIDPMATLEAERKAAETERKAPKRSVEHVAKEFVERYAKKRNRSWEETQRILNKHIVPAWGRRQIGDIARSDVNELLDQIEDDAGAPMATAVLAQVRKMFNWHATRDGAFNTPIVRGMARTNPKAMARDRVLSDDEVRVLWQALDASAPPYRQLLRFLLLTAQRREEAAQATASEIKGDLWTIPAERCKTKKPNLLPLSAAASAQVDDLGDLRDLGRYLFTTTGDKPFSGFSKAKRNLDTEMERIMRERAGKPKKSSEHLLKPWRIHDLRRTAKTLMQRAGIRPDISERTLGHVIAGVEGTYDRHQYVPEKRHALNALAAEVERILEGGGSAKVIPIRAPA